MEETIIRKYYNEYLSEAFDLDLTDEQNNCYIITDQSTRKYFINPRKGTVDKYSEIGEFHDGYALVRNEKGYNYINEQGELFSQVWFTGANDFQNGFALVRKNGICYFIDTEGKYIMDKSNKIIVGDPHFYPNGVAIMEYLFEGKNVMNSKGKNLFRTSFDTIDPFQGKYAVATKKLRNHDPENPTDFLHYENYIIDSEGNTFSTSFEYLKQVDENIFVAGKSAKGKKYLINAQGERIGQNEFDDHLYEFKEGYMVVENNGVRNLIGKDGEYLYKNWYIDISPLKDGVCKVKAENDYSYLNKYGELETATKTMYSFLDLEGNLFPRDWFDQVYNFYDEMAVVRTDYEYHILYRNGALSDVTFRDVNDAFSYINEIKENEKKERMLGQEKKELSRVHGYGHINYEFPDGTLFFNNPKGLVSNMSNGAFAYYYHGELTIYNKYGEKIAFLPNSPFLYNTATINLTTITESPKIKKVASIKKWFHYSYEIDGKKYLLDYKPVVDYGDIVICEQNDMYYIFTKSTLNTVELGEKSTITLESNFIKIGDKKYFISGLDFIDVTALPCTHKISKKEGVTRLLNFDEFKSKCQNPEYKEKITAEVEALKTSIEQARKAHLIEEAHRKKEEEEKRIAEKKENLRQSLSNLSEILVECSKYITEIQLLVNNNKHERVSVPEELLLVSMNDHLEINPIFLTPGILKFVDLSTISFKNVKISGIDLSYTNASINPQEIYNKDMSNGKYCGIDFNFASFKDVKTANADFSEAILDFATDIENVSKSK